MGDHEYGTPGGKDISPDSVTTGDLNSTLWVTPASDYNDIASALSDLPADGGTIYAVGDSESLSSGIQIDKPNVRLIARDYVLNGDGINITAPNCVVDGVEIDGGATESNDFGDGGQGIKVDGSTGVDGRGSTIRNCTIHHVEYAGRTYQAPSSLYINNEMYQCRYGGSVYNGPEVVFQSNNVHDYKYVGFKQKDGGGGRFLYNRIHRPLSDSTSWGAIYTESGHSSEGFVAIGNYIDCDSTRYYGIKTEPTASGASATITHNYVTAATETCIRNRRGITAFNVVDAAGNNKGIHIEQSPSIAIGNYSINANDPEGALRCGADDGLIMGNYLETNHDYAMSFDGSTVGCRVVGCELVGGAINSVNFGTGATDIQFWGTPLPNGTDGETVSSRITSDGWGINDGDPSSSGAWNGNGRRGVMVRDTTNGTNYVYVPTVGWTAL